MAASSALGDLAPLSTPLPSPPSGEYFTAQQWQTLLSIMDTVIPSIRKEATISDKSAQYAVTEAHLHAALGHQNHTATAPPGSEALEKYLDEKVSDNVDFQDLLKRTLAIYAREDARKGLSVLLSALNNRVGSLLLTGYATPFTKQPIHIRTAILHSWRQSYLPPLQAAYKQMTFMAKNIWIKTSPSFYLITGFPKTPHGYKAGSGFDYDFIQFPAGDEPAIVETDVVIVGSGCGGGVSAKNLAESGHRVLVLDKGHYYPPSRLPMSEREGGIHLFDNGGFEATDDGSTTIISGSTWGGGGTVNWAAALQTQGFVRKEWAEDHNLPFFATAEFQTCLDRVCDRMGVSSKHIRHNHGNNMILEGARKLGYDAHAVPQNTQGNEHYCGYCTLGCGAAQKQGPAVSFLPDAARGGAKFIEGFHVEKILFETIKGKKTAVGVRGLWTSRVMDGGPDGGASGRVKREIIVKAKKVIVSCGTLWSPIVLMKSGLKNYHIGRNLHLHPCNLVMGVYADDIRPWEGGILTTVCTTFENLDTKGHGAKLEATVMLPSWSMTFLNWTSGLDYKLQMLKYRHTNGFISITRDRDSGRVYPDPGTGVPRIAYTPSAFDRKHTMEGVLAQAKIAYITGAREIHICISGVQPFIRDEEEKQPSGSSLDSTSSSLLESSALGITDPVFQSWLATVEKSGNAPPNGIFASAHQMGTNRMSATPANGVVDPQGKVWGVEGLYVADASVFPSASGVNPMVTNMAISDWISRGIARELRR